MQVVSWYNLSAILISSDLSECSQSFFQTAVYSVYKVRKKVRNVQKSYGRLKPYWRNGFSQITITLPFLFMILHFRKLVLLTDVLSYLLPPCRHLSDRSKYLLLHVVCPYQDHKDSFQELPCISVNFFMKFILSLPEICAVTWCPFSNSALNALGKFSTIPSTS